MLRRNWLEHSSYSQVSSELRLHRPVRATDPRARSMDDTLTRSDGEGITPGTPDLPGLASSDRAAARR